MSQLKVAVIFGGVSQEHDISCKSAANIISHMDRETYEVIMIGITKEGSWLRYHGPAELIPEDKWINDMWCKPVALVPNRDIHGIISLDGEATVEKIDVIFPALHGKYGEDGCIQGLFELAGIPYVGCKVPASVLCMDKDVAHRTVKQAGVCVTDSVVLYDFENIEAKRASIERMSYPLFVKPASLGSSFGVTMVNYADELDQAIEEAFAYDHKIIVEQGVAGYEVGCSILGNGETLQLGDIDKIDLTHGFFRIHQEKDPEKRSENSSIEVPADCGLQLTVKIKETAKKIYKALGCSGLARVDMFVTPYEKVLFNEVNSMPGFTSYSRYPRMMKSAGISMKEVIDQSIVLALEPENNRIG